MSRCSASKMRPRIDRVIRERHCEGLAPLSGSVTDVSVQTVYAREPKFFRSDPAGYLVVYRDRRAGQLVVEHYTNAGLLDCVVKGGASRGKLGTTITP